MIENMKFSCNFCNDTGWVCENHPEKAFDVKDGCNCGGAGMPCICNNVNPPWDFNSGRFWKESELN